MRSHAESAGMLGYANARTVTSTCTRIKAKILKHFGGEEELLALLGTDVMATRLSPEANIGADQDGEGEVEDPAKDSQ